MFAQTKLCLKFARSLELLAHGVMVTLQFLVLAFKVRVLVGQQTMQNYPDAFLMSGFFQFHYQARTRSLS